MQTTIRIAVYEGERTLVKDNHRLGKFELTGLPPAPRGVPQVEVTFQIDENSILSVTAKERGTGKTESITITNDKGRLSKEEIDNMIRDSEKNAEQDRILKEKHEAKQSLDQYIYTMKQTIDDKDKLADKLESDDKSTIRDALEEASSWLKSHEEDGTKEEFDQQLKSAQKICDPIIAKVYQKYGGNQGGKSSDDEENEDL